MSDEWEELDEFFDEFLEDDDETGDDDPGYWLEDSSLLPLYENAEA